MTRRPELPPSADIGPSGEVVTKLTERWISDLGIAWEKPGIARHLHHDCRGQRIHTADVEGGGRVPLLLLHGWPTSYLAFHPLIESLRPSASALVLASLPGFAGSTPLSRADWTTTDSAGAMLEAMTQLGHETFVVHGQDWGSTLAREMSRLAPERILGLHVSAGLAGFLPTPGSLLSVDPLPLLRPGSARNRSTTLASYVAKRGAYLRLQTTRPDALAYALADSPVGMLAWFLDVFQGWLEGRDALSCYGSDFILANASVYALTNSVGSSMRIYAQPQIPETVAPIVPTGVSVFGSGDFADEAVSRANNTIAFFREHHEGSHVASLDAAGLLAADIETMIRIVT